MPKKKSDENKTRIELIRELEELRQQVAELKEIDKKCKRVEEELRKRTHDLGERIKELNCLYGLSRLIEKPGRYEGPFIKEERNLLNAISERLGKHEMRLQAEKVIKASERKYQDQQEQARKLNRRLMEDGEYNLEEVWHTHRNGSVFPMLMCGILVKEDTGEPLYIACTAVNISEKKILQDHLMQSERLADAGQLASSIAHEINSPLQGIISILDSLQEAYKDQAARRQPIITP
jgi:PAS domain S-box-containing protein